MLTLEQINHIEKLDREGQEFTWGFDTNGVTFQDFLQAAKDMLKYKQTIKNIRTAIEEQACDLILVKDEWVSIAEATDKPFPWI